MAANGGPRDGCYGVPGSDRVAAIKRRLLAAYAARVGLDVRITQEAVYSCNRFVARLLDRVAGEEGPGAHRTADVGAALGVSEARFARLVGRAGIGRHLWSTREALELAERLNGQEGGAHG